MNKRKINRVLKKLKYLPNKYFFAYSTNKIKHFYLKITKSTKVAYPSTIMLELTNYCNLACTTCPREYDYGKQMDIGQIDIENAKKVIEQAIPYLDSIGLTGLGETFLYTDIELIVDFIRKKSKGVVISVSTNANFPKFIERVSPLIGKIDTIQVSIDGLHETYEKIRLKGSFFLLDQNLKQLVKLAKNTQTDIMLNMVVTKENYLDMPALIDYAKQIGIKYVDFTLFNLASVTGINREYYTFYKAPEFLEIVRQLENKIEQNKEIEVTEKNFKTENSFQKCPFPWTHFYITWDGYVPPCCAKPFPKELNFGNVFEQKLMEVLNSSKYQDFRKMWFTNTPHKFCDKCHFLDIEPVKVDKR